MDFSELIAHPVRLRMVHALAGRALTTHEICDRLPDVPKASAYRHVGLLVDGGVLEVDSEQRVRGAVERRFRLRREGVAIDPATVASLSLDQHRRGFAAAMATLIGAFNTYLDQPNADPVADAVGYRQHSVWLSQTERDELIARLRAAILPCMTNGPAAERTLHLLSPILFPIDEPSGDPD